MAKEKLKNISTIITGVVVNRYASCNGTYQYKLLNINSVKDNQIIEDEFDTIQLEKVIDEKYLLKKDDIVMKIAKPYNAARVDFNQKDVIAPSNFIIIRTNEGISATYISHCLNSKKMKHQLSRLEEGTALKTIRLSSLRELRINLIEKNIEKSYANILELLTKKQKLINKKLELQKQIYDYYLNYY